MRGDAVIDNVFIELGAAARRGEGRPRPNTFGAYTATQPATPSCEPGSGNTPIRTINTGGRGEGYPWPNTFWNSLPEETRRGSVGRLYKRVSARDTPPPARLCRYATVYVYPY
ncbi:hypothetical protein LQZ19_07885 [Treponema primitia]|uniref:hypothetical protein n=1 Tax=Treponema primitia TaxID=88058 RepID=UPI00398146AB